jgi:hypothetical protein
MMRSARAPSLARRLAAALALLAMLALGLHEAAHAAGSIAGDEQALTTTGQLHLHATPDQGEAGGGPAKHHGAVPHSCHLCGAVMPMPEPAVLAPGLVVALPAPALAAEHTGLDPGGPRRPPRASLIA